MSEKNPEPGSLVVLLRALVMLVFLVGLPGVAVLKGSFPELCDELGARCRDVVAALAGDKSRTHESRDAHDAPDTRRRDTSRTPQYSPPVSAETIQSTEPPAPTYVDSGDPTLGPFAQPPVGPVASGAGSLLPPDTSAIAPATRQLNLAQPAGYDASSAAGPPAAGPSQPRGGPIAPLDPERAEQMVGVLRDLGATYYRLEKWGADERLFRFQCKMSVGGNPHVNRHFEATDVNANRAIEQVVELVRNWRGPALR